MRSIKQYEFGTVSAANRHSSSLYLGAELFVGVETAEHALARPVSEHSDLTAAAQALVELASQRDGSDNISVQLIRIRSVERVGMYLGRPYRLR